MRLSRKAGLLCRKRGVQWKKYNASYRETSYTQPGISWGSSWTETLSGQFGGTSYQVEDDLDVIIMGKVTLSTSNRRIYDSYVGGYDIVKYYLKYDNETVTVTPGTAKLQTYYEEIFRLGSYVGFTYVKEGQTYPDENLGYSYYGTEYYDGAKYIIMSNNGTYYAYVQA